ncbi:hypothetical protein VTN77DRAFT_6244 [Rasamsonia byssochlamydoides]|uniref:uncharacterized protein n=1 Tax=Rasamsonia byssochlamydoides TaxID=89139 RepID=UPI0037447AE1
MLVLLILLSLLVAVPLYIVYKPPPPVIGYLQRRWPDVLWHVPTAKKVVALTIDDGPSEYTEEIMHILEANDATATFFIIGSHVFGRETILHDLICRGNELANHAMHDEPSRSLSEATLIEQIKTVQSMIHCAYTAVGTEQPPKYFRPGSGFFTTRMRKIVAQLGHRLVLGSVYPHDPQIPFWRINAAHILSMVRPGSIIVCHDGRRWTAPMLRRVIPELRRRGYRVVTVTELLKEADS